MDKKDRYSTANLEGKGVMAVKNNNESSSFCSWVVPKWHVVRPCAEISELSPKNQPVKERQRKDYIDWAKNTSKVAVRKIISLIPNTKGMR